ncbi:MAG: apolipoprotein N-acyltransferase, partial [bacterium]
MSLAARRAAWAVFSGLLLWLSFPNPWAMHFEVWPSWVAFVALVPLLAVLEGRGPKEGFQLGFLTGSAFFLPGLLWLTRVQPLGLGAFPAWCGLAAWCALFPAAFGAVAAWGLRRKLMAPALWLAALWTLLEALREHLLTGFPWLNLGSSQFNNPAILPLAALAGQAGLTFAVALVNAVVCALLFKPAWVLPPRRSLPVLALLLALGWGTRWQAQAQKRWDIQGPPPGSALAAHGLKVGVVQGGIDENQIWNRSYRAEVMGTYLRLSELAADQGARLILWPESSFPGYFNEGAPEATEVLNFARQEHVNLLIGSTLSTGGVYTNSAVLVRPDGSTQSYAKRHLVPFGEYVPLRHWIPLLNRLLDSFGMVSFTPGTASACFRVGSSLVSPLICFESVFPDLSRGPDNPDLLAILTDDTWYGITPGPVWDASQAIVRAVENGCWVARSAATGISLVASPEGHVRVSADLGTVGVLVQVI